MGKPFSSIINPNDSLERQNEKLKIIVEKLMNRVEKITDDSGTGYMHFERAIALEWQVQVRTRELREALDVLNVTNAQLVQAQKETEKARKDLAGAVESIEEGFAIFDSQDRLILKNSRFSALLPDITDQIVNGITFTEFITLCANSAHMRLPDNLSRAEWLENRLSLHAKRRVNFTLETRDGHWMQVSEQYTTEGSTIILQTDITDWVRLEHEERARMLDEQAQIIKATLNHIDQAVLIFNHKGRLADWNGAVCKVFHIPATLLRAGTRVERFKNLLEAGRNIIKITPELDIYVWLTNPNRQKILRLEITTIDQRQYELLGQEIPDGSCLISFNDVTVVRQALANLHKANDNLEQSVMERTHELKEARDSAERANASKTRFVAAVSHDLLQPVNAVKLFISALQNTKLNAKQANIINRIAQGVDSVESILGTLLDISKLDSGEAALNISSFSLQGIFDHLTNQYQDIAVQKGLRLHVDYCSHFVRSDLVYLQRILQNLLSNALRYTQYGAVAVRANVLGDVIEISVEDTGPGIAKENQKIIFREFQRFDDHPAENAMGLGLAIVERACAMLKHPLQLTSEIGKGSKFSVIVPCDDINTSETLDVPLLENNDLQNQIILVIENDTSVRQAMSSLLESWAGSPIEAQNRQEAFMQIDALGVTPDIVIADYHLGNQENGLALIVELRQQAGHFFGLLLTADRDAKILTKAGAHGIFVRHKPVDIEELRHLLCSYVKSTVRPLQ